MSIAVIAGLGNPGQKYHDTRHNMGFVLIDNFANKCGAVWKTEARFEAETAVITHGKCKRILVKPQTYMNASGRSLGAVLNYWKLSPESLLVIYDDITLDLARVKLNHSGTAGGHNGVADLLAQVGVGFNRYRIGIGAKPHREINLADYVLSQFTKNEKQFLADRIPTYLEHLELILDKGIESAMNLINQCTSIQHEHNYSQ